MNTYAHIAPEVSRAAVSGVDGALWDCEREAGVGAPVLPDVTKAQIMSRRCGDDLGLRWSRLRESNSGPTHYEGR